MELIDFSWMEDFEMMEVMEDREVWRLLELAPATLTEKMKKEEEEEEQPGDEVLVPSFKMFEFRDL